MKYLKSFSTMAFCLVASIFLAGCSGEVTYEEKDVPVAKTSGESSLKSPDGSPVKVAVMPVSIGSSTSEDINKVVSAPGYKKNLWKILDAEVAASSNFTRVPLPKGAEADDIIQKTIQYAAGLLPAGEFAKVKSFKLPDRFLYGAVMIDAKVEQSLNGPDRKTYEAEAFIRMVDGKTLKYIPSVGKSSHPNLDAAIRASIKKALANF